MPFRGAFDVATHHRLGGWAWDSDFPDSRVSLVVSVNDEVVARVLADRFRPDLVKASIGDGHHAFTFEFPRPLSPRQTHKISVRREGSGVHVSKSPRTLKSSTVFDQSVQDMITDLLMPLADDESLKDKLLFLATQTDRLRQHLANGRSGADARRRRRLHQWSEVGAHPSPPEKAGKPRALVIDTSMPQAARDAGCNAILSHMRALQRLGYDVTFAPADLRGPADRLESEGIACCLRPFYATIEEVLRRQRATFQLVYLHRVTVASAYMALARDTQPGAKLVFSVADLHYLRTERQAAVESRPELIDYGRHLRLRELTCAWLADAVITHSDVEATELRRHVTFGKVHVVPWHVPVRATSVPFAQRRGIAFIGSFSHKPNVDAAFWLIEAVLPLLKARADVPLFLVGSNMPDRLKALEVPNVHPLGQVGDLMEIFDRVRLSIAPLAYGAGIKGKVLDSLAAGIPCVCTPAAAEGLDLPELLRRQIASTAEGLAARTYSLHQDEALNEACSRDGLAFVEAWASEKRVDACLRDTLGIYAPVVSYTA